MGDRLRLFSRMYASFGDRGGNIGNNGSVVEVEKITPQGLQLRNAKGSSGFVKWETMRDVPSQRIKLTYGDVVTIDAIQAATSTEHLNVLPNGSADTQSFKNYVAQSRSRETTWLVVSDGRERSEIMTKRALGNIDPIDEDGVWKNVAANLARQPEKELATDLLRHTRKVHTGTVKSLASAFQPMQQRAADGKEPTTLHRGFAERHDEKTLTKAATNLCDAVQYRATETQKVVRLLKGPNKAEVAKAVREARRSAAARPKRRRDVPTISPTEAQAEFADALHRAGLRPKGAPVMDGRKHRVPVEGDKRGRLSGTYIGHLDGYPAGYIHNFKSGDGIKWKASRAYREMTPEKQAQEQARVDAERANRESERQHRKSMTAHRAVAIWNRARPAKEHPYLTAKGIVSHGLRQDSRGNLLVPMRDVAGKLWGVQSISPDGAKLFLKGGRKQGTQAQLGTLQLQTPLVIAEGYATAATLREVTGLPTVAAFDSGNLMDVAQAYQKRDPGCTIIIAGDNDHHLSRRDVPLPNVGREKAEATAAAVGGLAVIPNFAVTDKGSDWNDYAAQHGRAVVRQAVEAVLRDQGITLPAERQPGAALTQAARDAARQQASAGQRSQTAGQAAAAEAARRQAVQRTSGPRV